MLETSVAGTAEITTKSNLKIFFIVVIFSKPDFNF